MKTVLVGGFAGLLVGIILGGAGLISPFWSLGTAAVLIVAIVAYELRSKSQRDARKQRERLHSEIAALGRLGLRDDPEHPGFCEIGPLGDGEFLPRLKVLALLAEFDPECYSCGEGNERGECPNSHRACGHHCNCSWVHEHCHWCGKEWAGT